eukprot:GILI01001504.1.p1 GENE.GILI01001504.1~~GILI01001504.1.p1  ORF type:complete len:578 (+),score=147.80 GILI01001504.1:100-1833(+)
MKALHLVSLALSAAAFLASFASAEDISFCTVLESAGGIQTFSAGNRKIGNFCRVDAGETLRFDGSTTPQVHVNNTAATLEFTASTVGAGGLLWIMGTATESVAATTVPYIVNVNGVVFSQDAAIVIQGSFGKGSDISISTCTFNVAHYQQAFASAGAFGILLFDNSGAHRLYDNSRLRLTGNTVNLATDPNNSTSFGIGFISQLKLGSGTSVEVTKNTINVRNTAGGTYGAFGMAFTGAMVPQGNDAKFQFVSNTVEARYATPLYLPEISSPIFSFKYNVTENTVRASPAYAIAGDEVATLIRPISLGSDSIFSFTKNSITSNASDALVMATSVSLNDNAAAYFNDNDLFATGGSPSFGIQGAVNIPSGGELIMEFNHLRRNDSLPQTLPPFYFGSSIQLQGVATLSISHNNFDALNKASKQFFVGQTGSTDISKGSNANAYVCNNWHYGEELNSQSMQTLYISDRFRAIVNALSTCGARATTMAPTTTTTTTPTSTTTTSTTTLQTPNTGGTRAPLPGATTRAPTTTSTRAPTETTTSQMLTEDPELPNGASAMMTTSGAVVALATALVGLLVAGL